MTPDSRRAAWRQLKGAVEPEARSLGFRSRGSAFYRAQADVLKVFAYQADGRAPRDTLRFCVNLEIYVVRLLTPAQRALPSSRIFSVSNPHWRERLTERLTDTDQWWEIGDDELHASSLIAWHAASVADRIVPRLDTFGSEEALVRLWESGRAIGLTEFERQRYLSALAKLRNPSL